MKKTIRRLVSLLCMLCILASVWLPLLPAAPAERASAAPASVSQELTATDGSRYLVTLNYDTASGIPEGAELRVAELTELDESYADYLARSAEALGAEEESIQFARALDISLYDPLTMEEYQPTGSVSVSITLPDAALEESGSVDVVHFGEEPEVLDASVSENAVAFETEGFSVYLVIAHEGDTEVVEPRVEFHFIASESETADTAVVNNITEYYYISPAYSFYNKGGVKQSTLIIRDGEKLESIEAPYSTQDTFFFGWYTVDYNSTTGTGIKYSWPDGTQRVELDKPVSIDTVRDSDGAVTSLTWSVNGVSQTVTADSGMIDDEGCAHVYLAPIYSNYYFVNFHMGPYEDPQTSSIILARKLIVLGNSQSSEIRVSDLEAASKDPLHVVFVGWETRDEFGQQVELIRTIDENGAEIMQPGKDGTYIPVGPQTVDLYPYFEQARWISFDVGPSGNGALYQGPQVMFTSDVDLHERTSFDTTTRVGFNFDGWFLEKDGEGYGTGTRITDANGEILDTLTLYAFADPNADPDAPQVLTYKNSEAEQPEGSVKAFEIKDGEIKVYAALDSLTLYSTWKPAQAAPYKVIIWKQKVTDSADIVYTQIDLANWLKANPNKTEDDFRTEVGAFKTYDYYTYYERDSSVAGEHVSPLTSDLSLTATNPNGLFTGFQLGVYDSDVEVNPQGTTVLNVYYDRITYTVKMFFARRSNANPNGNYQISSLNGTYNSPTNASQQTWQDYVTKVDGMAWENTNTNNFSRIYTGDMSRIGSAVYNGYTYLYYVFRANYGAYIADKWPDFGSFPNINNYRLANWWRMRNTEGYINGKTDTVKGTLAYLDKKILGLLDAPEGNFLLASYRGSVYTVYEWTYNLCFEVLDGVDYTGQTIETRVIDGVQKRFYVVTFDARSSKDTQDYQVYPEYLGFEKVDERKVNNSLVMYYYYNRKAYSLTFMTNYPATTGWGSNIHREFANIPFETSLSGYATTSPPDTPEGWTFDGWYYDAGGTKAVNFNDPLGLQDNLLIFAKWKPIEYPVHIDPAGGVIDHINYGHASAAGLAPTGLAGADTNAYNRDHATYFDNEAGQTITEYTNLVRPYVEVSEAEAATMAEGTVYRYVYTGFTGMEAGKDGKLGADARNAVYILDTQASLDAYYDFYVAQVADRNASKGYTGDDALVALPRALWESTYVSEEKYRVLRDGEHFVFLGWYEVDQNGDLADMPFDFASPATHETTLRAVWRLDGGYSLLYTPDFYFWTDESHYDFITGNLVEWQDPNDGGNKYADGSDTQAMQEPSAIKVNGVLDEVGLYQFRGWQIVSVTSVGNVSYYTPLEPGVFYTAGQALKVQAKYADEFMIIHMQAVFERRDEAYRRPDVVNLTLDASRDAMDTGVGYVDPSVGELPGWSYPFRFRAIGTDTKVVSGEEKPYKILFGDAQSNAAVHLYQYATVLTESDAEPPAALDPAGKNYFVHSGGYKLVGFDIDAEDTNCAPDIPADGVISVSPRDSHTLYAVWEPMVYITFKNETGQGDVVLHLGGSENAMYIVNQANGAFSRTPIDPSEALTIPEGESVKLVMPYGEGETVSATGTNTLGTGWMLTARSELGVTNPTARTLKGEITGTLVDFTKVPNTQNFGFSDTLVWDEEGIVVTFTADQAPHTLVLEDNYNGNGTGGGTKEVTFGEEEPSSGVFAVFYEDQTGKHYSYTLPSASTRVGYELLGWDPSPTATDPTYKLGSWEITDLNAFFTSSGSPKPDIAVQTLYAIWKVNVEASWVYVWKEVPVSGERDKDFTFAVAFGGEFEYTASESYSNGNKFRWKTAASNGTIAANTAQGTAVLSYNFTLKHNQYLKIYTYKHQNNGDRPYLTMTVEKYQRNGDGTETQLDADDQTAGEQGSVVLSWYWKNKTIEGNPSGSGEYHNFDFNNLSLSVTEADYTERYRLGINVAGSTNYPLTPDTGSRKVGWTDSFAGGTVIFTNTRKTADLTISKTLLPDTLPAESFPFTLRITNGTDDTHYENYVLKDVSRHVNSGDSWTISGIPTGAALEITETVDDGLYETGYQIGSNPEVAGTTASLTLTDNTEVAFTNERKTQNVRIVVMDDEDQPLDSAQFTCPGVFSDTRYAAANTGLVWEGTVYTGDYTLTEINMPNRLYRKLTSPVSLSVLRSGVTVVTGDTGAPPLVADQVNVTYDAGTETYTVTVVNPKQMLVTVQKKVEGGSTSGSFGVTATLTAGTDPLQIPDVLNPGMSSAQGTNADGRVFFTLVDGQRVVLYVPKNASVQLVETEDAAYTTSYQIGADAGSLGAKNSGQTADLGQVSANRFVLYTNELKTKSITIRNTMISDIDSDRDLSFGYTLTLLNVTRPIGDFILYDDPDDDTRDLKTDTAGQVTFRLKDSESLVVKIPVGASVTLAEDVMPLGRETDFAVFITIPGGSDNLISGASSVFRLTAPEVDTVIRVFNIPSICKVTDGDDNLLYVLQEGWDTSAAEDDIYIPAIFSTIKGAFVGRKFSASSEEMIGGLGNYWGKQAGGTYIHYTDTSLDQQYKIQMLVDYTVPNDDVVVVGAGYNMVFTTAVTKSEMNAYPDGDPRKDGYPFRRTGVGTVGFDLLAGDSVGRAVLKRVDGSTKAFVTVGKESGAKTRFEMSELILDGDGNNANLEDNVRGGCLTAENAEISIDHCYIYNFEAKQGGAVYTTGDSLTVKDTVFDTCKSDLPKNYNGGGAIHTTATTLTITGTRDANTGATSTIFSECSAVYQGGAVYQFGKNKTMTVTGSNFIDCTSRSGGALQADVTTVSVTDCTFTRCIAQAAVINDEGKIGGGNGGGMNNFFTNEKEAANSSLTLTGCTFEGCAGLPSSGQGDLYGGGLRSCAMTVTVTGCTFKDDTSGSTPTHCSAKLGGGASFDKSFSTVTISGCTFTNCTATSGGGVYVAGTLTMSSGTITGCTATNGGGVYAARTFTMSGGSITKCSANKGGGVFITGSSANAAISGGTISENYATGFGGGGIRVEEGAKVTISGDVQITGNYLAVSSTERCGGAIGIKKGEVTISGGTISGNYAKGSGNGLPNAVEGGAIFVDTTGAKLIISGGTITGNYVEATNNNAIAMGGAIFVKSGGVLELSGGTISDNTVKATNEDNARGAGIYLEEDSTLKISGSPSFGGADTENDGNYTFTEGKGNLLTYTLTDKKNGGQSYPNARQDIYIAGYSGAAAGSVNVTGEITSGTGAIWVWAEAGNSVHSENDHIHEGDQFALMIDGVTVSENSLNAFRNARIDDDTGAASSALYGVKSEKTGEQLYVIWGTIGGADVSFMKVDGFGTGLANAEFVLYDTYEHAASGGTEGQIVITPESTSVVTGRPNAAKSDANGDVKFRAPLGIFYMKETVTPTGYTTNTNIYIVLVGSGNVTAPNTQPAAGNWSAGGVLGSLALNYSDIQSVINSQRGAYTGGKYEKDSAVFLCDQSTGKAVSAPDIAAYGIMNISAATRRVILRKADGNGTTDPYQMLRGARFRIFRPDLTEVTLGQETGKQYYESLSSGVWFSDSLNYGKYYLVETLGPTRPSGYTDNAGTVYELQVKDTVDAPVKLTKLPDNGTPIVDQFKSWYAG